MVHVSSEHLTPLNGSLSLSALRWADGKRGAPTTEQVSLQAQGSFSVGYEGAAFAALLNAGGCAAVADCFIEIQCELPMMAPPVTHQWLTLWRDAVLKPATLTVAATSNATNGVVSVTVVSDVVAPTVMVHCRQASDFGTFNMNNGMMVMPGVPHTLTYTPRAFAPAGKMTPCVTAADFYAVSINGLSDAERA
jgi:hypothetical protein